MKTLKFISLNIWGGRLKNNLLDFLDRNHDIDLFCFQEVFNTKKQLIRPAIKNSVNDIFEIISDQLPDHKGYYCVEQDDEEGVAMFVRRSILDRLEQSKKVTAFLRNISSSKILMGDFNLLPNTQSIKILEKNMDNLIKKYHITGTRSSLYEKPEKYADYIFVSPEIKVVDFKVLPDIVSDHLALYLTIEC